MNLHRIMALCLLLYPILGRNLFEQDGCDPGMMPLYGCSSIQATCVLIGNSHGSPWVQLVYISEPLMYLWRQAELYIERTVVSWQRWCLRANVGPRHTRMIGIEMYGCFPLENRACSQCMNIFDAEMYVCIYIYLYAVSVIECRL